MVITRKTGQLVNFNTGKSIDWLALDWFEVNKRILHKQTHAGISVTLKFLNENPALAEGDILFEDEKSLILVQINPCDCIVIHPKNMFEMASICYEIGNKHLPLFYENDQLLVPFDVSLFRLLSAKDYHVRQEVKKLLHPLKTTVSPHCIEGQTETLFSRIMKLTTPNG